MRTHTSRPCTTLCRTSLTLLLAVLLAAAQPAPPALASTANDASARQTFEIFQAIPGLSADQLAQGQAVIGGMHYNAQRIFRKVCALPGVTFDQARQVADRLKQERFTFEQVQAFESLTSLPGADIRTGIAGLDTVRSLSFSASRAFRSYTGISGVTVSQALAAIPLLNTLDEAHIKAARALFAVQGMQVDTAHKALNSLNRMRINQARAVETYAAVPGMDTQSLLSGMEIIARIGPDNAWNARCLFTNPEVSAKGAWNWLTGYFVLPTEAQEAQFDRLDSRQKSVLLKGLYDGNLSHRRR